MKNRLLVLLLLFVVCSSFFVSAPAVKAEDSEQYETAVSLIRSIYPDYQNFNPDAVVTRGEFSMMLAGIMGVNLPEGEDSGFADVYIDNPASQSIVLLTKMGVISKGALFYPDAPIQYEQAIKMMVAAAGYTQHAEAQGGYPYGYIMVASSIDLTKDLFIGDGALQYRDVTLLFNNMLDCKVYEPLYSNRDVTFLEYYRKIYSVIGVVTANENSGLTDYSSAVQKGTIKIGTKVYTINGNSYATLLGYSVRAYYEETNGKDKIVFMHKYECDEVELISSDIFDVKDHVVYVDNGGKEIKYRLNRSYIYIKNGKQFPITSSDEKPYFMMNSGNLLLIDNDSDGIYDIVYAWEYKYSLISSVDAFRMNIVDQNTPDSYLDFSDNDCTYNIYSSISPDRTELELSDLGKDMLIAYAVSADKKLYNIFVCENVIEGNFSGKTDSSDEIYISGSLYHTNSYFDTYYSGIELGKDYDFYLGVDGTVAVALPKSESSLCYGWIVACGHESGLDARVRIKIFSQDGNMLVTNLARKVSYCDEGSISAELVEQRIALLSDDEKFVKYSVNGDDDVNRIIRATEASPDVLPGEANESDSDFVRYVSRSDMTLRYRSQSYIFSATDGISRSSFRISPATYCFIIPSINRGVDSDYVVYTNPDSFVDGTDYNISAYDLDKSSHAGATIVFGEVAGDRNSMSSLIVEDIVTTLNENDEEVVAVKGYSYGTRKFVTYYSTQDTRDDILNFNPGDIIRIRVNSKNEAVSVILDFDSTTYTLGSMVDPVGGNSEFINGLLYNYTNGYMNIFSNTPIVNGKPVMPSPVARDKIVNLNISSNAVMFVDLKRSPDGSSVVSATVRPSDLSEIRGYTDVGNNADYVVARRYMFGRVYSLIVYKIV